MFAHTCTACHKRRLIFADDITGVNSTDHGIVVSFACWCGADQTMTTGLRGAETAATPEMAPTPLPAVRTAA